MKTSLRAWRGAFVATAAVALVASCSKSQDSLVVFQLTADAQAANLSSLTVSVGTVEKTFPLEGGLSENALSFGVYVPSSVTGQVGVGAKATPSSGCVGYKGTANIEIPSAGATVIVPIVMRHEYVCTGDGGITDGGGTAGRSGSDGGAGASGTAGASGSAGMSGTAGATGTAGAQGTAGVSGTAGAQGTAGASGTAGVGGTAGTSGTAGATGTAGVSGAVPVLSKCVEVNHDDTVACTSSCDFSTEDWAVYGVAFSPDGTLMVTGGNDGRVKIWNVVNQVPTPSGHVLKGTGAGSVAFSPDGKLLAVGRDGTVELWSVGSWTAPLRSLTVSYVVYGVAFSPDSTQVISVDHDESSASSTKGDLYVHAVTGGAALHNLSISSVYSLAVAKTLVGGALPVAVSTFTGLVQLTTLDATGFAAPTKLTVNSDGSSAEAVEFSPDGATVVSGGDDGIVHFWSLSATGASEITPTIDLSMALNDNSEDVYALAFDPSGANLIVGGGFFGSLTSFGAVSRKQVGVEYDTPNVYDIVSVTDSSAAKLIAAGEIDCGCVVVCKQ